MTKKTHWLSPVEAILMSETSSLRKLAKLAGADPKTFYQFEDLGHLNAGKQNLRGMKFRIAPTSKFVRTPSGPRLRTISAKQLDQAKSMKGEMKLAKVLVAEIKTLEKTIRKGPQDFEKKISLAEYYFRIGQRAKAIAVLERATADQELEHDALVAFARAYLQAGLASKAVDLLERKSYRDRRDEREMRLLAEALIANSRPEDAVSLLKEMLTWDSGNATNLIYGEALFAAGFHRDALEHCYEMLVSRIAPKRFLGMISRIISTVGVDSEEIARFLRQVASDDPKTWRKMLNAYAEGGHWRSIGQVGATMRLQFPAMMEVPLWEAEAYLRSGRPDLTRETLFGRTVEWPKEKAFYRWLFRVLRDSAAEHYYWEAAYARARDAFADDHQILEWYTSSKADSQLVKRSGDRVR